MQDKAQTPSRPTCFDLRAVESMSSEELTEDDDFMSSIRVLSCFLGDLNEVFS